MEKNVTEFVGKCVEKLCEEQAESFISEVEAFECFGYGCCNTSIESPIEQILFAAILCYLKTYEIALAEPETVAEFNIFSGILIEPQHAIGKYRVDFKITNVKEIFNLKKERFVLNESKFVLIECDSQKWHERTEKERRYEKTRDRYFAKQNLKIFHYTGKEIIEKPYKIAAEILGEILGYDCLGVDDA